MALSIFGYSYLDHRDFFSSNFNCGVFDSKTTNRYLYGNTPQLAIMYTKIGNSRWLCQFLDIHI